MEAMERQIEEASEKAGEQALAGGKFLTFMLNNEGYGLRILKVREIIGLIDITPVPQTPEYVVGVINLRGKVIPVIDLRKKFNLPASAYTSETCIIVVDVASMLMGIVVDSVSEVLNIDAAQIEPTPSFGARVNTEYIMGLGKMGDKVKILLDIDMVLNCEELVQMEGLQGAAN